MDQWGSPGHCKPIHVSELLGYFSVTDTWFISDRSCAPGFFLTAVVKAVPLDGKRAVMLLLDFPSPPLRCPEYLKRSFWSSFTRLSVVNQKLPQMHSWQTRQRGQSRPSRAEDQNNAFRTRARLTRAGLGHCGLQKHFATHLHQPRPGQVFRHTTLFWPKTLSIQLGQQEKGIMGFRRWRNALNSHNAEQEQVASFTLATTWFKTQLLSFG